MMKYFITRPNKQVGMPKTKILSFSNCLFDRDGFRRDRIDRPGEYCIYGSVKGVKGIMYLRVREDIVGRRLKVGIMVEGYLIGRSDFGVSEDLYVFSEMQDVERLLASGDSEEWKKWSETHRWARMGD